MPIQDMFSVEVDALFAQKGAKFNFSEGGFTDTVKVNLNYVDIPVMGRINLTGSATRARAPARRTLVQLQGQ